MACYFPIRKTGLHLTSSTSIPIKLDSEAVVGTNWRLSPTEFILGSWLRAMNCNKSAGALAPAVIYQTTVWWGRYQKLGLPVSRAMDPPLACKHFLYPFLSHDKREVLTASIITHVAHIVCTCLPYMSSMQTACAWLPASCNTPITPLYEEFIKKHRSCWLYISKVGCKGIQAC